MRDEAVRHAPAENGRTGSAPGRMGRETALPALLCHSERRVGADDSRLRVNKDGSLTTVVGGLDRPTSVEIIDNTAYVVTLGGEVWRVDDIAGPPFGHGSRQRGSRSASAEVAAGASRLSSRPSPSAAYQRM